MFADAETEPTAARRLIAFAGIFLGLITFSNINLVDGQAVIAPPIALIIVLLAAIAGIMVWVRGRWSRTLLWAATAIAILSNGAIALAAQPASQALGTLVLAATAIGALASIAHAVALQRSFAAWLRYAPWVAVACILLLAIVTLGAGPGPRMSIMLAAALVIFAWLLRPEEP